jgi:hypothetical protein
LQALEAAAEQLQQEVGAACSLLLRCPGVLRTRAGASILSEASAKTRTLQALVQRYHNCLKAVNHLALGNRCIQYRDRAELLVAFTLTAVAGALQGPPLSSSSDASSWWQAAAEALLHNSGVPGAAPARQLLHLLGLQVGYQSWASWHAGTLARWHAGLPLLLVSGAAADVCRWAWLAGGACTRAVRWPQHCSVSVVPGLQPGATGRAGFAAAIRPADAIFLGWGAGLGRTAWRRLWGSCCRWSLCMCQPAAAAARAAAATSWSCSTAPSCKCFLGCCRCVMLGNVPCDHSSGTLPRS